MSDEAVKERTGKEWAEVVQNFGQGWREELAAQRNYHLSWRGAKVGPWWGKMVAVAYEHERGIREKFQKCDGEFAASGSRTLCVPMKQLYEARIDEKPRRRWLPDAKMEITTATPNKSLRAKWDGGKSRLSVNFYPKKAGKNQVTVDHMKLARP